MIKILNIGCGENKEISFLNLNEECEQVNVDVRPEVSPDIICDARVLPFEDSSFDIIYSSHTLEHFGRNEIFKTLKEWYRVLKKDGEFWIIVPDIKWAAKRILKENLENPRVMIEEDKVLSVLYGDQTYELNAHKTGFTRDTLYRELELLGLKRIEGIIEGYNIVLHGIK